MDQHATYRLYRGHFGGGGPALQRGAHWLTLLREPAALVASTLAFIRRESGSRHHNLAKSLLDDEFLHHDVGGRALSNRQVLQLAFDVNGDCSHVDEIFAERSAAAVRRRLEPREPVDDERRLEAAWARIEASSYFGLAERFADSLNLFAHRFSVPHPGKAYQERRETTDSGAVLRNFRRYPKRLAEVTRLDRELHGRSTDLFERRLRAMTKTRIELVPPAPAPKVQTYRQDFSGPFLGVGLHRREAKLPEGDWFRWTGPDDTALIWLPADIVPDSLFRVRVVNAASVEHFEGLTFELNGLPLALSVETRGTDFVAIFRGRTPDSLEPGEPAILRLVTPPPARMDGVPKDRRTVGVALHWIEMVRHA